MSNKDFLLVNQYSILVRHSSDANVITFINLTGESSTKRALSALFFVSKGRNIKIFA
jgi:hypothetical protein